MLGIEAIGQKERIQSLIQRALEEDLETGDVTTLCIVSENRKMKGVFTAKEDGIVAGMDVVAATFAQLDWESEFSPWFDDGDAVKKGDVVAEVEGSARALLSAERTALNILQRMSGIATETRKFVDAAKGTSAVILDTRKTVPGLRILDKMAVKLGGGQNHRFGLFDMVMIKDNHITAAGTITEAVKRVRAGAPEGIQIEVEVKNLKELHEALAHMVDRILLDNMSNEDMAQAVEIAEGLVPLEASGNMTLERIPGVAATGVDFISIGGLTHSVKALDISLLLEEKKD